MTSPLSGGCACGRLRYEARGEPIVQSHCQCRDCQRVSGTGHASYLVFGRRDALTVTGEPSRWRVAGDSGNAKIHGFCPTCGAPVLLEFAAMPEIVAVHAASLDEPGRFAPRMVTYTSRGHGWDRMDPALTALAAMPTG